MSSRSSRGFTITEMLIVIGLVVLLLGLLLGALAGVRKTGTMAKSMANMRQIGHWMKLYASDNREHIVPSQFNYTANSYKGKVRALTDANGDPVPPLQGELHRGTWTDILWTVNGVGVFPDAVASLGHDYSYDSPDQDLYELTAGGINNPFRSAAANTQGTPGARLGALPMPYGCGATEEGLPGFFGANNFFNADPDAIDCTTGNPLNAEWFTTGQIRLPERSMYLVDSFAGEVIQDDPLPFQVVSSGPVGPGGQVPATTEVDFRYNDSCLMLFLDGHVEPVIPWDEICDLEGPQGRGIRIRHLTSRSLPAGLCPFPPP